jgi:hypothetical protein
MVVLAFFVVAAAGCLFFLYVLVQFWREEKHPRRSNELPVGYPVISSGQIVMPVDRPREERRTTFADQQTQGESENRR